MTGRLGRFGAALVAFAVLAALAAGLRLGTGAARLAPTWDEGPMAQIVADLVERGWTVERAIDYQDTKGPAFFWLYGAVAEVTGADVSRLRLLSAIFFALAGIPLGLIAGRCGIMAAGPVAVLALLWALVPYNAVLGQLFMSEASFMLGGLALLSVFQWGFGGPKHAGHRVGGPIIFGCLLAVLLHHRVHAVAWAAAVVLAALARDGRGAWPWLVACAGAGLARLPLLVRWGGFVSSDFQERLGLGFSAQSLVYLAASLAPAVALLAVPVLVDRARPRARWWLIGAAAGGAALGLLVPPDLSATALEGKPRFMGMVATVLAPLHPWLARATMALLAGGGMAGLAAALCLARRRPAASATGIAERLAAWSVVAGWAMYSLTRGVVYDRYALPFMILLPLLWLRRLPRVALGAQALVLLVMAGRQAAQRLL